MTTRFLMLLRREWMQHRTAWLILMTLPTLLMLGASFFEGSVQINLHMEGGGAQASREATTTSAHQLPALIQVIGMTGATAIFTAGLALLAVSFQAPGLARRDQQDRSIEFWRSLPVPDSHGVGAMLIAHLLAMPWAALAVGLAGGLLVGLVVVVVSHGPAELLAVPWGTVLAMLPALATRLAVGLLLGVAWASPLLLGTMLASGALRRWGVPVLGAALLLGVFWLDPRLPTPLVKPALALIGTEALQALVYLRALSNLAPADNAGLLQQWQPMPRAFWADTAYILGEAMRPAFAVVLAVSSACFAGLVALRRRAG